MTSESSFRAGFAAESEEAGRLHRVDRSPLFERPLRPLPPTCADHLGLLWGFLGSWGLHGSRLDGAPINIVNARCRVV